MKFTNQVLLLVTLVIIPKSLAQFCYSSPTAAGFPLEPTYSCAKGFYCPNTTESNPYSIPQMCPPSFDCQQLRLQGEFCTPQGDFEPQPCPKGYYCPTFREKIECPEGNFCPIGQIEPIECESLSYCPSNSHNRLYYGCLVVLVVVDAFLAIVFFSFRAYLKRRDRQNTLLPQFGLVSKSFADLEEAGKGFKEFAPKPMEFKFENLRLTLKTGKTVLDGVTGEIKRGRVTAIMGPSGSGKTTFLTVLMGKVKRTGGKLFINGKEEEMHKFKKLIGFVPQEDVMLRELTVRDNISFSAKVRLPRDWNNGQIDSLVDNVIESLNLSHVQHNQIGDESKRGVSGGQRKRVNIGIELAAGPSVLFLDEPTSGLDSTQALQVAGIMKQLANIGMTIVSVIHQPRFEIFNSFDDILLLAPGGKTVYMGPVKESLEYFMNLGYEFASQENPADVLMDIVSGKPTKEGKKIDLPGLWAKHSGTGSSMELLEVSDPENESLCQIPFASCTGSESSGYGASFLKQVWLNHNRYLLQQYRTFISFVLEVGVASLAGFLMGLALMGNAGELYQGILVKPYSLISPSALEFIIPLFGMLTGISVGLAGAPAGVKTFGEEKVLYWREAAAGHSKVAYYLGKTIATFYRFSVTSLHFSVLYYVLSRPIISFWKLYAAMFMMFYCVYGLAAIVSMLVRRENSSLLAVVVCLFAGVFNGFGPTLKTAKGWGIDFLWELSYARWATEGMYSEELSVHKLVYEVEKVSAPHWGYTLDRFNFDIGMMVVIGLVYRIIAFVLMIMLNRQKTK